MSAAAGGRRGTGARGRIREAGVEGREGTSGSLCCCCCWSPLPPPSPPPAAAAAAAAAPSSSAARLPLDPDPPAIAESWCCDEERAKRPGRGARRLLPPELAEGGRGDGDSRGGGDRGGDGRRCCCPRCRLQGEREGEGGEARGPLLPSRLLLGKEGGGGVSDLGQAAAAALAFPPSTSSSPSLGGSSPSSATAAASLIACCDLLTAGDTAKSGRDERAGAVGAGEGLFRGEALPSGGKRLLQPLAPAFGARGLGVAWRGRRGGGSARGGRGAAASFEGGTSSAASAAAALSSSSSSSRSAPRVPAALSACCSRASSKKAAKMSVGTRSRWPRS